MDAATRAWLLAQLGEATPTADLETRYTRLGKARAVALEVLRGRLAALIQQPATVNVPNAIGVGFGENIKALERQIASLEAGVPAAPDDPPDTGDDTDSTGQFGVFFLHERPRR
ncbi:hypothetical protein [Streptomyces sp. NPDC005548]|uniref:hypothetical protein n=1 Tax=Streptomyces sp. NPDC005548 TaxID=3364724 RepID=UPI0036B718A7